ncbi:MAG TPA: hypothetical protein VF768_10310, partial [Holophagaceae bacterium]
MELTDHDLKVLRLAADDLEGRLTFALTGEGDLQLRARSGKTLLARDSLPRLEAFGLIRRVPSRAYVLTPQGWDAAMAPDETERWMALHPGA